MSWELILPYFPKELRALLLDPSISDLMVNGTIGVYADKGGVLQHIPLTIPYTNERLQGASVRVARLLGQDLTTQNPILNTRLLDGSRVAVVGAPSSICGPTLTIRKFNRWYSSDELIASGSMTVEVRDKVVAFIAAPSARPHRHGRDTERVRLRLAPADEHGSRRHAVNHPREVGG